MTAVDVEVVLEAAVPAVEGSGQGGAFHLNVHPVTAGTGRPFFTWHVIIFNKDSLAFLFGFS